MEGESMKEHPRLLNTEMVQEVLARNKTQTRDPIKNMPDQPGPAWYFDAYNGGPYWNWWHPDRRHLSLSQIKCPFGVAGDLLYVRETWWPDTATPGPEGFTRLIRFADDFTMPVPDEHAAWFDARSEKGWHKRPSIHIPKWSARIWLKVEKIRVGRIQDISEQDAWSEGIDMPAYASASNLEYPSPRKKFAELWDSIYKSRGLGWKENPWVWVADFSVASTTGREGV
jgi:hypothetical protein